MPSVDSERASTSEQWADPDANLLLALFSFLKRPQRHEKCPLQPLLWGAPKGLNTALPGSHKQPRCQSESIHSSLPTAYATESGAAIVLDRRGRGRTEEAGREENEGNAERNKEAGEVRFLIFPTSIIKRSKEKEGSDLPRRCSHKTQIQVTGLSLIRNKQAPRTKCSQAKSSGKCFAHICSLCLPSTRKPGPVTAQGKLGLKDEATYSGCQNY